LSSTALSGQDRAGALIRLAAAAVGAGEKTRLIGETEGDKGVPFPAAIALVGTAGNEKLLVAGNLSDDVLLLDPITGAIEKRFDLSESDAVPRNLPRCSCRCKGRRACFVALWNASEIVELDLKTQSVGASWRC
jgi:hypothetical protein